jgi:hypothetical protein
VASVIKDFDITYVLHPPVMAVIALTVRDEGGPDVVFRQTRVGLDERPIKLLKFRSLRPATSTESQTQWNIKRVSRLRPVAGHQDHVPHGHPGADPRRGLTAGQWLRRLAWTSSCPPACRTQ